MFFGQEREVRLGSVTEALAAQAAGTDGRQGLQHLVTVTQGVTHGVKERIHALLLVRFQHVPGHGTRIPGQDVREQEEDGLRLGQAAAHQGEHDRTNQESPQHLVNHRLRMREQHRKERACYEEHVDQRKTGKEKRHVRYRDKHQCGTQVRLFQHEGERDDEEEERDDERLDFEQTNRMIGKPVRDGEQVSDFCKF